MESLILGSYAGKFWLNSAVKVEQLSTPAVNCQQFNTELSALDFFFQKSLKGE